MRSMTYAAAAVLATIALSCSPRDRRETASTTDSVAVDVSRETNEAVRDVREDVGGDYTYARRDEFRREVDERVRRLDQEIAELSRTAKRDADKARDTAVVHIRQLRRSVNRSLDQFAGATESTWENVKDSINQAVDSLDLAVRAQRPDAKPMGGNGPS